jgi:hypothetical protein
VACLVWASLGATAFAQIQAMPPSMAVESKSDGGSVGGLSPSADGSGLGVTGLGVTSLLQSNPFDDPPSGVTQDQIVKVVDEPYWEWQVVPDGLIYRPYLASGRESRVAAQFVHDKDFGWLLDGVVGLQAGLLRYGSLDSVRPSGFQMDFETAAFPRLALEDGRTLVSSDFRLGTPLTFRQGAFETKLAVYHLSSHLSDCFTLRDVAPVHYSRDALVWGLAVRPIECWRLYAEADWAFHDNGTAKPWQFQFGFDASPLEPTGIRGAPFFAINSQFRQDVDYCGNFTVQTGWQWRGNCGQLYRTGLQYFNGKSNQGQFYNQHEQLIGMGLWYDH